MTQYNNNDRKEVRALERKNFKAKTMYKVSFEISVQESIVIITTVAKLFMCTSKLNYYRLPYWHNLIFSNFPITEKSYLILGTIT